MEVIKDKKSHKQQLELKQKIQSEKQRMEREQDIHVPYHRPKQYSLKEFLSRKHINKPWEKPRDEQNQMMTTMMSIKLETQNIEEFAQKIKEREEEALGFFRSESESDGDDDMNGDKENVSANPVVASEDSKVMPEVAQVVEAANIQMEEKNENCDAEAENLQTTHDGVEDLPVKGTEPPAEAKNPEDLELDRLREKYKDSPTPRDVKDAPKWTCRTLDEMGSKDSFIDLGTGVIYKKQLTGPEMLFQRYLKSVQKPKIQQGVSLKQEVEPDRHRPGVARGKLQENLLSQITQLRLGKMEERMKKKVAEELEPDDKEECEMSEDEADEVDGDDESEECEEEEEPEEFDVKEKRKKSKGAGGQFLDEEVRTLRDVHGKFSGNLGWNIKVLRRTFITRNFS